MVNGSNRKQENMKAVICDEFGSPEKLKVGELPNPKLSPDQVLVAVKACGVSFPDLLIIQNKYQFKPELPFSPGGEVVGEVIEIGENVGEFQVGDYVLALCSWGGFAEKVAVDQERIFSLPKSVAPKLAAASLYTLSTSYHGLKDRANLQKDETLVVLGGAGGVGLAAVELGVAMGAKVIAATSTDEKLTICQQKGAMHTINYEKEDLKTRIKELTDGKGADVIFDPVGGKYTDPALRAIAWKGRYLIVGFAGGDIPKIPMNLPLLKGCAILGVFWGSFSRKESDQNMKNMNQLISWLDLGMLTGPTVLSFALEDVQKAFKVLEDRASYEKCVIDILL